MHLLIPTLWVAVQAECLLNQGTQFWSNTVFRNLMWAKYMVQSDVKTSTYDQQVQSACGANYVMCPSINVNDMQILSLKATCRQNPKCTAAYTTATKILAEDYHTNILERFAYQLNPPTNVQQTDTIPEYQAAQDHIVQLYGTEVFQNNGKYFTLKNSTSTAQTLLARRLDKVSQRFAGPDVDLRKFVRNSELVRLSDDPYMLAWADFFAIATLGTQLNGYTAFKERTLVSHSLSLCWSMIVTGWETELPALSDFIPSTSDPALTTLASAQLWANKCGNSCGPASTSAILRPQQMCSYGNTNKIATLANCKKNCLQDVECIGIYWGTAASNNANAHYVIGSSPSTTELYQAEGAGTFNTFLALTRHSTSHGLQFNRDATSALLTDKLPSLANFQLQRNANTTYVPIVSEFTLKRCTDDTSSQKCLVFENGGVYKGYKDSNEPDTPNATVVRTYLRTTSDTAGQCEAYCMADGFCLAWTWNEEGCKIDRSIGPSTRVGHAPNLASLNELGLDTTYGCDKPDHAMDLCSGKCVNIHDKLAMGWCNHPWVLCQGGKYADIKPATDSAGITTEDERLCVGGAMPDVSKLPVDSEKSSGYSKYRFAPYDKSCVLGGDGDTLSNACVHAKHEKRTSMLVTSSIPSTRITGTYRSTKCGTVGAGPSAPTVDIWQQWTKQFSSPVVAGPDEYITNPYPLPSGAETNTYVTASNGIQQPENGPFSSVTPFASSTSGVFGNRQEQQSSRPSDCHISTTTTQGSKQAACLFPTCILDVPQTAGTNLYDALSPSLTSNTCDRAAAAVQTTFQTALKQAHILPPASCISTCNFGLTDASPPEHLKAPTQYWNGELSYTSVELNMCRSRDAHAAWIPSPKWGAAYAGDSCIIQTQYPEPVVRTCKMGNCLAFERVTVPTTEAGGTYTSVKGTCTQPKTDMSSECTKTFTVAGFGPVKVVFKQPTAASATNANSYQLIKCRTTAAAIGGYPCDNNYGNYDAVVQLTNSLSERLAGHELANAHKCSQSWTQPLGKYFMTSLESVFVDKYRRQMATPSDATDSFAQSQIDRLTELSLAPFLTYASASTSANPDRSDIMSDGQYAEYANQYVSVDHHLPNGVLNAANKGFMCPVGLVTPSEQILTSGKGNSELPTEETIDGPDFVYHPYAQLTAKCPASKPYRCSHITMQKAGGGTCEYGYNWQSKEQLFTSGGGSYRTQIKDKLHQVDTSDTKEQLISKVDFMEQIAKNAQCHLYDFGCFTAEDARDYSVCGIHVKTSPTVAGGALCGTDPAPLNIGAEGFCGIKVNLNGGTTSTPKHTIDKVTLEEAYAGCKTWPNKEPVCATGFVLQWLKTGTHATATCLPIAKASKPTSRIDSTVTQAYMMPRLSKQQATNSPYVESVLCSGNSVWSNAVGCVPILCKHRGSEETCTAPVLVQQAGVDNAANICLWNHTRTRCTLNAKYAAVQDAGARSLLQVGSFSKYYWPGFQEVTDKPSFAGVGPAYAYSATSCGAQSPNCQGFAYCNNPADTSTACLDSDAMVNQCCQTPNGALGSPTSFAQVTGSNCEMSPSAMCAGGNHLFLQDDQFNQHTCSAASRQANFISEIPNDGSPFSCECCKSSCLARTEFVHTQTDYKIEADSKVGPSVHLKELFGVFVDTTDTNNPTTVNANSCLGPDNRLIGSTWNGNKLACACRVDMDPFNTSTTSKLPYYESKPDTGIEVSNYCADKRNTGTCIAVYNNKMYQTTPPTTYSCDFNTSSIILPETTYGLIHTNISYTGWESTLTFAVWKQTQLAAQRRLTDNTHITDPDEDVVEMKRRSQQSYKSVNRRLLSATIQSKFSDARRRATLSPTPRPITASPTPKPTQYPTPIATKSPTPFPYTYSAVKFPNAITDESGTKVCPQNTQYVSDTDHEKLLQFPGCKTPLYASCPADHPWPFGENGPGTHCCSGRLNSAGSCLTQFTLCPGNTPCRQHGVQCCTPMNAICPKNHCFRQFPMDNDHQFTPGQCAVPLRNDRALRISRVPRGGALDTSAQKPTFCVASESCAYTTRVRTTLDAFVPVNFGIDATVNAAQLLTYDPDSYRVVRTSEEAHLECIARGSSCIGYAAMQRPSHRLLEVLFLTPENQWGQPAHDTTVSGMLQFTVPFVYKRLTSEYRPDWKTIDKPSFNTTQFTYTRPLLADEAISTYSVMNYCAIMDDCRQVLWSDDQFVLAFDKASADKTGLNNLNLTPLPTNGLSKVSVNGSCTPQEPYAYDFNGKIGNGCCSSPDISSTGTYTNYFIDRCPESATMSYCSAPPCHNYGNATTCPVHAPCVHGESLMDAKTGHCSCFCSSLFTGDDCSQCSRQDAHAPDCARCKSNFVEDGKLCVCKNGYDIATNCTKCLPFVSGNDCRTNTCQYFLGKGSTATRQFDKPGQIVFKNTVLAQGPFGMLYDGIYAAGDGNVPDTMQNSFVLQNKQLYWIGSYNGKHTKQRVVNTAVCMHWNTADFAYQISTLLPCTDGKYAKDCSHLYVCNKGQYLPIMDRPAVGAELQWHNDLQAQNNASGTVLHTCSKAGYKMTPVTDCNSKYTHLLHSDFASKEPDLHNITHYLTGGWLDTIENSGYAPMTFQELTKSKYTRGAVCVQSPVSTDPILWNFLATHAPTVDGTTICPHHDHNSNSFTCTSDSNSTGLENCVTSCASKGPVNCAVYVWQKRPDPACGRNCTTATYQCYHITQSLAQKESFPSSVLAVYPGMCYSGGLYGTGEWRNNPNKPEFAVPLLTENLTPVDLALQYTLVCAWDAAATNSAYLLSQYRRHVWAGTNCSSHLVNRIDSNWLMSLPRGTDMNKTRARAAPGGTVRLYNQVPQANLDVHGQNVTHAEDAAACGAMCGNGCDYWYYGSNTCIRSPYVPVSPSTKGQYLDVESWGGSAIVAVVDTSINPPLSCEGHPDGARLHTSVCFRNKAYSSTTHQIDTALIVKNINIHNRPYLRMPDRFAVQQSDSHLSINTQHSASGCAHTCQSLHHTVYQYDAGMCRCYNPTTLATENVNRQDKCWSTVSLPYSNSTCNAEVYFIVYYRQKQNSHLHEMTGSQERRTHNSSFLACKMKCLSVPRCITATLHTNLTCTLFTPILRSSTNDHVYSQGDSTDNVSTIIKLGGCRLKGSASCLYSITKPFHDTRRTDKSTANGANFAYAADVNLYYGDNSDAATIQVGEDNDCTRNSASFDTHGVLSEDGLGLSIPNLLFLGYIGNMISKSIAEAQVTGAPILPPSASTSFPLVSTRIRQAQSFSLEQFYIHTNTLQNEFALTQSYAFPATPGATPSSCQAQGDLASALVSESPGQITPECMIQPASLAATQQSPATCTSANLADTGSFDRVRNMYLTQSRVCMEQIGLQSDPLYNVPVITYIQPPPAQPNTPVYQAYYYQGLPIYAPNNPATVEEDGAFPHNQFIQFGLTTTRAQLDHLPPPPVPTPAPLPTPIPAYSYNKPGRIGQLITNTSGNCKYTTFRRTVVNDTSNHARMFTFDISTYLNLTKNATDLKSCAGICNTLLLCRLVTFKNNSCNMYGATAYGQNLKDALVSETNDGCRLLNAFFDHDVTRLQNATVPAPMAVKDDCCIANSPIVINT